MLKAYQTQGPRRALRVILESDYLDSRTLEDYRLCLDCVNITPDLYISLCLPDSYPRINIDEYFNYIELMGTDISILSKEREESFSVLLEILETKYGIEYVDADD